MIIDVDFKEANTAIDANFAEADTVIDGAFDEVLQIGSYDAGFADGRVAEYNAFWDAYQESGARRAYMYAFGGGCWTDAVYNPKYPIIATGNANSMFSYTNITDTKVDIDISGGSANRSSIFLGANKLETVRKLIVSEIYAFASCFSNCTKLKNLTIEGAIGRSANFQWCPLSVDSMKSVISCLVDYSGTDSEGAYTLTFNSDCWAALENDSVSPNGGAWKEYVRYALGWAI